MPRMNRREFLINSAMISAAVGQELLLPSKSNACGPLWGELDPAVWSGLTRPDINILEIHLSGGVAPFDSFYYRPEASSQTRGFDADFDSLSWRTTCSNTPVPSRENLFFAKDLQGVGKDIHLGPISKSLWKPHILDHLRVIVSAHNLFPHEAAIPFGLTGLTLGNPRQASLGSPIQRHHRALDLSAGVTRTLPYSYGILPSTVDQFIPLYLSLLSSVGQHPGCARPLVMKIDDQFSNFVQQLNRSRMKSSANKLLDEYRQQFKRQLTFPATGLAVRSKGFADYETAVDNMFNSAELSTLLASAPYTIGANGPGCISGYNNLSDVVGTSLEMAVFLLTRPSNERARYVCMVDPGVLSGGGLSYDVHNAGYPLKTSTNLWYLLDRLQSLIQDPLAPDPNKLNLDNTLILINTEFGRTPFRSSANQENPASNGTDHWPEAYAQILIGGGIQKGVVGSIKDGTGLDKVNIGVADEGYTPTDVKAALLVAAGVNPFEPDVFPVGEISVSLQGATHIDTAVNLRQRILGL